MKQTSRRQEHRTGVVEATLGKVKLRCVRWGFPFQRQPFHVQLACLFLIPRVLPLPRPSRSSTSGGQADVADVIPRNTLQLIAHTLVKAEILRTLGTLLCHIWAKPECSSWVAPMMAREFCGSMGKTI